MEVTYMFNNNGYSLSDIASVAGRNEGLFGGDNGWWIILLFLFAFGGGGWGGFGGGNGSRTREEIALGFDVNNLENGIRGIQQGLCDGFYAINTGLLNGFNGVNVANMQNTAGLQAGLTALGTQLS
jgi:hypothetical protein